MRVLVQRVSGAEVTVAGESVGKIGPGILALVGIGVRDGSKEVDWMASKVAGLRIFRDDEDKMNRSLLDVDGEALVVSQFTLYGNCDKGRRPSFIEAAPGPDAEKWVDHFAERLRGEGVRHVATGRFGAMMDVSLTNDGPVTLWIEREPE